MNAQISQQIEAALASLTGAKTEHDVEVIHADVRSLFEVLTTTVEDTLTANEALTTEVERLSKASESVVKKVEEKIINLAEHVFEFAGKKFGFNYPKLTLNKQVITPVEVKASPELQKILVESKHSMIKEL